MRGHRLVSDGHGLAGRPHLQGHARNDAPYADATAHRPRLEGTLALHAACLARQVIAYVCGRRARAMAAGKKQKLAPSRQVSDL